ncbi:hypothetical protein MIZ03_4356 [Rhodoferax lithotrophicus]|uniref:Uncharacterized protein n=1 Tax=Rhodoferax lithotrophicus TaxID=2798804 RepID=A0ABN6DCF3_9BURK|nr:hypothetical protein [Rhodoferax sp. MIZ03]BCO27273.1 hypothetical protein MIZ03_2161 [Rhodoferax sp. MIZ03]BCO29433.1 hypothetical protein MIZ03_4356 [Rhodoferax sp. MIZ03]
MNSRKRKRAISVITIGGLLLDSLELFASNFDKIELMLLSLGFVFCGAVAFRFQQQRAHRQLDLRCDSALW